ncbi:MAG: hypothetical protein U0790_14255 [Isosphaeraceae bacterium]
MFISTNDQPIDGRSPGAGAREAHTDRASRDARACRPAREFHDHDGRRMITGQMTGAIISDEFCSKQTDKIERENAS